jgi:hypothetical protein
MARLFAEWPDALRAAREVADACAFSSTSCATNTRARSSPRAHAPGASRAPHLGRRRAPLPAGIPAP